MSKVIILLACLLVAIEANIASPGIKRLNKKISIRELMYNKRGPGINWTWYSWSQGPTCPDNLEDDVSVVPIDTTTAEFKEAFNKIDDFVKLAITQLKDMGYKHAASLGIVYNGKVIHTSNFGTIDKDKDIPPTADTIYAIASNTKIFTSLMFMDLVAQGIVELGDPVSKFYNKQAPPEFKPMNPYGSKSHKSVTLQSLSTHTSGLPRELGCGISAACTEDMVMKYINAYPLFNKPLTTPHYSNLGTSLLARCLERAYNKATKRNITYEDWIQENVFNIAKMYNSGFNYSDMVKAKMAYGYTLDSSSKQVIDPLFATEQGWGNGCGGIHSTVNDMLKFMANVMEDSEEDLTKRVLSPEAYELYRLPGTLLPDGLTYFGLGTWESAYINGFHAITKSGLVGGFGSSTAMIPKLKFGVATWLNLETDYVTDQLSVYAFNTLLPLLLKEMRKNAVEEPLPENLEEIVGLYKYQGVTYFNLSKKYPTQKKGRLIGTIVPYGTVAELIYNEKASDALKKYKCDVFTIKRAPIENADSCFMEKIDGVDDSQVFIQKVLGKYYVSLPDSVIWSVPKE